MRCDDALPCVQTSGAGGETCGEAGYRHVTAVLSMRREETPLAVEWQEVMEWCRRVTMEELEYRHVTAVLSMRQEETPWAVEWQKVMEWCRRVTMEELTWWPDWEGGKECVPG